jgi:hypothetical protein
MRRRFPTILLPEPYVTSSISTSSFSSRPERVFINILLCSAQIFLKVGKQPAVLPDSKTNVELKLNSKKVVTSIRDNSLEGMQSSSTSERNY